MNTSFLTGWLTLWKATGTGWEPNQNGEKIDEIRCCGIPTNATGNAIQVGACCPAGKQWSSTANQCVAKAVDKCLEGQYYCHSELKCKPAGATCGTVTCNNNNVCDTNESCDCADCTNGGTDDKDKCGFASTGAQMVCTKDVKNTTTSTSPVPTTEKWVAYTYPGYASSYIYLSKLPTESHTIAGQTFYVYNPERIITGMTETAFLANPSEAIKNAKVLPIGNTRDIERLIFNTKQLESEAPATQTATLNTITSFVAHRYMCTEDKIGATNCSNNGNMGWTPSFGTTLNGDIFVSAHNNGSGVTFAKAQKL